MRRKKIDCDYAHTCNHFAIEAKGAAGDAHSASRGASLHAAAAEAARERCETAEALIRRFGQENAAMLADPEHKQPPLSPWDDKQFAITIRADHDRSGGPFGETTIEILMNCSLIVAVSVRNCARQEQIATALESAARQVRSYPR